MTKRIHIPGVGSRLRPLLLASSIISLPMVALAQPVDGLYIGAGAGANIMSNQTLKSLTVPATFLPATGGVIPLSGQRLNGHVQMNGGFSGELSVGWGFGELTSFGGPRVEIEGNYMNNPFQSVGVGGGNFNGNLFSASGQEQKYGVFGNVLWDFNIGAPYIYPYLGVGVGGQWSQWIARFNNRLGLAPGPRSSRAWRSTTRKAASPTRRSWVLRSRSSRARPFGHRGLPFHRPYRSAQLCRTRTRRRPGRQLHSGAACGSRNK